MYKSDTDFALQEQKKVLNDFAGVFTMLEPCNFRDIFAIDAAEDSSTRVNAMELLFQQALRRLSAPRLTHAWVRL